jgi:hypothetical protein
MKSSGRFLCLICLLPLLAAPASGGGILHWTAAPTELAGGEADGIAISSEGRLFMAPRLSRLGSEELPGHPQQVWSVTADRSGNLYLGTGPAGGVLRVGPTGSRRLLFSADEPLVTALALTPRGELLAATAPGGRIYKINLEGGGALWCETGERYVWSLAVSDSGKVFAGTGERGLVLEIDGNGGTSPHFDSDEPHITALLPLEGGRLAAGGAGRGLVYEIDADGNALVLYDGDLPQVTALAAGERGEIFAAMLAPPLAKPERPTLRLRLPDGVEVADTDENIGSLEERKGPLLQGTIEGLPEGAAAEQGRPRGSIIRIKPGGEIDELWHSLDEAPFSLVATGGGEVLFGTGEPARLYQISSSGEVALLTTLDEAQASGLLRIGRALFLSTSNPAAAYRLEERDAESGVYISRPFDAGGPARWGSLSWRTDGGQTRIELYTRTGNSADPDGTWSGWSPMLTNAESSPIVNPEGRFLQWRVRMVGSQSSRAGLSSVRVSYEPFNRAPVIESFGLVDRSEALPGKALFRCSAADPDDDPILVEIRYRSAPSDEWRLSGCRATLDPGSEGSRGTHDLLWETSAVEEGRYEVQLLATDRAANALGEGREASSEPPLVITIDRTPPQIEIKPGEMGGLEIALTDSLSEIRRLELLHEGELLYAIRAVDGMCDSRSERFRLEPPAGGDGWVLRGVDAAGNSAERALP